MAKHLLFSDTLFNDSWLSNFFKNKITEYQVSNFKEKWIKKCIEKGINDVWICIDGSNDDCDAKEVNLAENGHNKSKSNSNIVSYMWAVSSVDGTPITFNVYRGGRVDSKAIKEIATYLNSLNITIRGIILDRGFCDVETLEMILEMGYQYVVMLKENTNGHTEMVKKYGQNLKLLKSEYMLNKSGMYGVMEKMNIFKTNKIPDSYISLFYDTKNCISRVNTLTDNVKKEIKKANDAVLEGKTPKISDKYNKYITKIESNGYPIYVPNNENLQESVDTKGFSSIATSIEMNTNIVDNIYST